MGTDGLSDQVRQASNVKTCPLGAEYNGKRGRGLGQANRPGIGVRGEGLKSDRGCRVVANCPEDDVQTLTRATPSRGCFRRCRAHFASDDVQMVTNADASSPYS
jgi:hypothetical protein